MEDTLKPFIKCVFPDPEEWRGIRIGAVFMFWRGLFPEFSRLVAHGTPLSIAFQIVREGIVVGNGTHYKNGSSRTGYFVMHGGSTNICVQEARNRSTSWRCAEYQIDTWPSSWTVPCVLTWEPWHGSTVTKLVRLHNDCWKACIESSPGTRRRMPHNMSLWINGYELERYTRLQSLRDNKNLYMTCGGRWNDHIYWSKKCNNMPASCGRCIPTDDLHSTDSSWTKTPNAKIWFCKECRNRKCSPWEGNFTKKDENIISRWIEGY